MLIQCEVKLFLKNHNADCNYHVIILLYYHTIDKCYKYKIAILVE